MEKERRGTPQGGAEELLKEESTRSFTIETEIYIKKRQDIKLK